MGAAGGGAVTLAELAAEVARAQEQLCKANLEYEAAGSRRRTEIVFHTAKSLRSLYLDRFNPAPHILRTRI